MADSENGSTRDQLARTATAEVPAHGISLNLPSAAENERPPAVKHMSMPAYHSPLRHHRRTSSRTNRVKETLDAHSVYGSSEDDGSAIHRVNQYAIKQEIGRGSFGAVHLAVDQYGTEFAVKEFSKSRLRKRAQSNLLRRPRHRQMSSHLGSDVSFNYPMHRQSSLEGQENAPNNSLDLIKEEIAIMKKLNHNNLVSLIEVMDDPMEDSLYMVLEMCKKGVVMKVGLDDTADPYDEETCRCWFRDMILGIEYLHAQGIIHRDLKPDNCLITADDVLKIVDFGVSEMFEKQSAMETTKSAGSPAFLPPELCVARHGQVSGRAADIWSMGVTLYCLRYGKIPFEKHVMIELYEAIRNEEPPLEKESDKSFLDLMSRVLEKDPEKRIKMAELRDHPWVTKNGEDPLLPAEENCADLIDPPTEQEKNRAITGNMGQLMVVMKAVERFKRLLHRKRPEMMDSILGRPSRIVAPPHALQSPPLDLRKSRSQDNHDRKPLERVLNAEGIHHDLEVEDNLVTSPKTINFDSPQRRGTAPGIKETPARQKQEEEASKHVPRPERNSTFPLEDHAKGHAHDPLRDTLFLDIGAGPAEPDPEGITHTYSLSESPGAAENDIYEKAYEEEMERILQSRKDSSIYMVRRLEHRDDLRKHDNVIDHARSLASPSKNAHSMGSLTDLIRKARIEKKDEGGDSSKDKTKEPAAESEGDDEVNDQSKEPAAESES